MSRVLWVHPFNGVAGDMFLGALIDAGARLEQVRTGLDQLRVEGWKLTAEPIMRNGISATNVNVECHEGHVHRTAGDIERIVSNSDLAPRVKDRAISIFRALADAEGAVHGKPPDEVHFHEVGGIDAIVDVVGSCLALEDLAIDRIVSAPIAQGSSIVRSAHGLIPNPAPATVRLLEGLPIRGLDVRVELTTPTGAALLRTLAEFAPLPAMTVAANGFGAGDNELDEHPNLLHVVVGQALESHAAVATEPMTVLSANVDDLSPEYIAHAVSRLVEAGARDAWSTLISMKKGRQGQQVSALVEPIDLAKIGKVLLAETGSLGYRIRPVERHATTRQIGSVEVRGHQIRIKASAHTAKAEFDDVAAAAAALGEPARLLAAEAERLWLESQNSKLAE